MRKKKKLNKKFLQTDGKKTFKKEEKLDKEQIRKDIQEEFSPKKFFNKF